MAALLQDGLNITGIGMGVVFTLLTLLVFIIRGMSALCRMLGAVPSPAEPAATGQTAAPTADQELIIAISAAIAAHRRRRRGSP